MVDKNTTMNTSNEIENDGEGDDTIVTMVDVLKEEEMMQENIDAVLGPADDQNCTFEDVSVKIKMFLVLTKIRYQLSELKKTGNQAQTATIGARTTTPRGICSEEGLKILLVTDS